MRDDVARQNAGARSGRVLDGGNHLGHAVFAADFNAQSAKTALGHGFHFLEGIGIQIGGVRVQVVEHAFDRIADQGLIGQGLHVCILDGGKHIGELLQFAQRQGFATLSGCGNAQADQNAAYGACCHQTDAAKPSSAHAHSH